MSSEWRTVEVGDVCSVGDGAHSKVSRQAEGVLYLTSKNIGRGNLKLDNVDYISQQDFDRLFPTKSKATRSPLPGDILIGIIGTFGNAYIYKSNDSFGFASSIGILRPDPLLLNSEFLYYVITSRNFQIKHANYNAGSVQGYTNIPTIKKLSLPLPPLVEQVRIAGVLKSLDDRITLLRETNATLEAIAQALFKSWFVDFDPVRAKQEGRAPEGMDEATAALFPDGFEESELGLVPRGWRVHGIDQTCDLGRGSSPRPIQQFMGGDVPWIKIADATASDGMFVFETKEMIINDGVKNSVKVRPGDLIMSNSASCGITVFVELDGCIHDGWLYFKNYRHISKNFLFFWLRKIAAHLVHIADGSVQKNLNIAMVSSQRITCPSQNVLQAFETQATPLLARVRENCVQAQTLAALRDTALPRLISGQLRLPEAEAMVANAGE